jgi:hypothetical protein
MANLKRLEIPLESNNSISLAFTQTESGAAWTCTMSDETMTDIQDFFASGYYKLSTTKSAEVTND